MDRCDECGFVYDERRAAVASPQIVEGIAELSEALAAAPAAAVGRRRADEPEVWSPLEYACHLRDVLLVQRERVLLARRVDEPELVAMGRDERVEHDGYSAQALADVLEQLRHAAQLFAGVLDRIGDDWGRTVVYAYPAPAVRSLRWVAVHTVHEVVHHTLDVGRRLS